MPPPMGISCDLCGQQFFKRSLPIHRKQCEKRYAVSFSECKKCLRRVSNDEYEMHVSTCTLVRVKRKTKEERKAIAVAAAADKRVAKGNTGDEEESESDSDDEDYREACSICTRKFSPERISKHEQICVTNSQRKARANFPNSADMRLKGTEFEKYMNKRTEIVKPPSRWREEHDRLCNMVEQGRLVAEFQKDNIPLSELPPPGIELTSLLTENKGTAEGIAASAKVISLAPGMECCPYCERNFNSEVAARHIPSCAKTVNKPKRLVRKSKVVLHRPKEDLTNRIQAAIRRVIASNAARSPYFETKEASMFRMDEAVLTKDGREGVVKFIGRIDELFPGYWIGLELNSGVKGGHHDGSLQGHKYFHCGSTAGMFVRPSKLSRVAAAVPDPATARAPDPPPENTDTPVEKEKKKKKADSEIKVDMRKSKETKEDATNSKTNTVEPKSTEVAAPKQFKPMKAGEVKKKQDRPIKQTSSSMVTKLRTQVKQSSNSKLSVGSSSKPLAVKAAVTSARTKSEPQRQRPETNKKPEVAKKASGMAVQGDGTKAKTKTTPKRPETNKKAEVSKQASEMAVSGTTKTGLVARKPAENRDAAGKKQIQKDAKMLARLAGKDVKPTGKPGGGNRAGQQTSNTSSNTSSRMETVPITAKGGSGRIGREAGGGVGREGDVGAKQQGGNQVSSAAALRAARAAYFDQKFTGAPAS